MGLGLVMSLLFKSIVKKKGIFMKWGLNMLMGFWIYRDTEVCIYRLFIVGVAEVAA